MRGSKKTRPGRRVSIWLPAEHDKISKDIDNLSHFVQLALEQAVGIMAFDIIKQKKGLPSKAPTQEQLDRWNADHPLDPLTAKRKNKWPNTQPSPKKPELW